MSTTEHRLYEWHGAEKARAAKQGPATATVIELDRTSRPVCDGCFAPVQKVVGGWWCDSCELAVG